jgi:hypothetical protein
MTDKQTTIEDECEWITIVKDKKPHETWRAYAKRASANNGLSVEVCKEYDLSISRGIKPRTAALEALESFECQDNECRETIKVYRDRAKWIERPRLIKLPNVLLDFLDGDFTFTIYKRKGTHHSIAVIDDSEILALLLFCSALTKNKIPEKIKSAAREGRLNARLLMSRRESRR